MKNKTNGVRIKGDGYVFYHRNPATKRTVFAIEKKE